MPCCSHSSNIKYRLSRRSLLGGAASVMVAGKYYIGPAAAAGEPVRLGFPNSDHYAPIFVAQEKGYFKQAGLQVDIKPFQTGGPVVEGLVSNSMDIGFLSTPGLISVARNFALTGTMGIALEGSGIVVKKGGIQHFEELAGRKVALPARGSIAHVLLLRALTNAKVDPSSVHLVEMGDPQGLRLGLIRGEVDAVSVWEPWVSFLEQSQELQRLALSHDIWPNHQCDVMWVGNKFLKERPDSVKAVIDAIVLGMDEIHHNFTHSSDSVAAKLKVSPELEQSSMHRQQFTHMLQKQNLNDQYALLAKVGIVKQESIPSWERLVDPHMYAYALQKGEAVGKRKAG